MNEICPVCNGLYEINELCSRCETEMDQAGKIEDYYGPYSPYAEKDAFVLENNILYQADNSCIHLCICPLCNNLQYTSVKLISV
jgi:hypothetical protein